MHRMAIEHVYRNRYVGAILYAETIARAFDRGLVVIDKKDNPVYVYAQTNDLLENRRIIQFHQDSGFEVIGRRTYVD